MRTRSDRGGMTAMAVVRPLVMLATGLVAGVALWRYLMLEPAPTPGHSDERLSATDRRALGELIDQRR